MADELEKRVKELEERVKKLERLIANLPVSLGMSKKGVNKLLKEFETKFRKEFEGKEAP